MLYSYYDVQLLIKNLMEIKRLGLSIGPYAQYDEIREKMTSLAIEALKDVNREAPDA